MEEASRTEHFATRPTRRVLVTGASGYIGRRMVVAATGAGFEVVAGVHVAGQGGEFAGVSVRVFDLALPDAFIHEFPKVDAVIHLAAVIAEDSHPAGLPEDINVSGTRSLLEAARRHGVERFVFVSSQSAVEDAPSRYGRAKWAIERLLTGPGEVVVRPGMVSGGVPRGLYGRLYRLCRSFPVLPVVRPFAPVYPVHVDDLCAEVLRIVADGAMPLQRTIVIAPDQPTAFAEYLRTIASERVGQAIHLVPVPALPVLVASRLAGRIPWLRGVSSERVVGLLALRPYPSEGRRVLATPLGDVRERLACEGRRRRLIIEARTLMGYVLGRPAPRGAVRRYVRALSQTEEALPLRLPRPVQRWPRLLRALEPLTANSELRRRLCLATRIAEMTPAGALRFHGYEGRSLPVAVLFVSATLAVEVLLLPLRWLARRHGPGARHARDPRDGLETE